MIFPGRVSDEEVPQYYAASDCFVTYSYAGEGFGLTLAEAMACGTPVVCSSLPAYQEVVGTNAILVSPNDPEELTNKLRIILKDPALRVRLGKNGVKHVQTHFSWEKAARQHIIVYENVIQRGRQKAKLAR